MFWISANETSTFLLARLLNVLSIPFPFLIWSTLPKDFSLITVFRGLKIFKKYFFIYFYLYIVVEYKYSKPFLVMNQQSEVFFLRILSPITKPFLKLLLFQSFSIYLYKIPGNFLKYFSLVSSSSDSPVLLAIYA